MTKPSLTAALTKIANPRSKEIAASESKAADSDRNVTARTPGRRGKKQIAGFFDPAVSRQLRQIALENASSVQQLLREALNNFFHKHGQPPIA